MKKPNSTLGLTEEVRAGLRDAASPEVNMADALNMAGGVPEAQPETDAAQDANIEYTPEVAAKLEQQKDLGVKATALADAMVAQQFDTVRIIGQMQTLEAFRAFSAAGNIKLFQQVKEAKAYKGLRVPQPDGSVRTISTFDEFCELMGTSRSKVDEDLLNLRSFGESFMETSKRAGLGYRDLRALRALPEDARQIVIEGEKVGNDPEALRELLEDLAAKNANLKKEVAESQKRYDTRGDMLADKDAALNEAKEKIRKLTSLDVDGAAAKSAAQQREGLTKASMQAGLALEQVVEFLSTLNTTLELPHLDVQMREHLEGLGNAVAGSLADLFANRLPWRIDFQSLVFPDWIAARAAEKTAETK